jgi:uncharacterized protein YciI
MANFAVRLVHGPGWDPSRQIRDQDGWDEHAAFMDGLVDDGFIILGGPVGDGEQTLHAVEAADENEIRSCLAKDPWASAGLLRIGGIEPWALWLDGRPRDDLSGLAADRAPSDVAVAVGCRRMRCVVRAWMPRSCRPGCMVAASTSNAARQGRCW